MIRLRLAPGTRLVIVNHDPMDFELAQTAGPAIGLGGATLRSNTVSTFVFRQRGFYVFSGRNKQTSEELQLGTVTPDNVLVLKVRVQ